jgi:hypothetical protein
MMTGVEGGDVAGATTSAGVMTNGAQVPVKQETGFGHGSFDRS